MKLNKLAYIMILFCLPQSSFASEREVMSKPKKTNITFYLDDLLLLDKGFDQYNHYLSSDGSSVFTITNKKIIKHKPSEFLSVELKDVYASIDLNHNSIKYKIPENEIRFPLNKFSSSISKDTSIFIGRTLDKKTRTAHSFLLNHTNGDFKYLLPPEKDQEVSAKAISANGNTVIGSIKSMHNGRYHAFRYDNKNSNSVVTDLGTLKKNNSGNSLGLVVSADGNIVAGISETDSGKWHVFSHNRDNNEMRDLGFLPSRSGSKPFLTLTSISENGDVIVGNRSLNSPNDINSNAFYYNKGDKKLTKIIKNPNRYTEATKVSRNGHVIIGQLKTADNELHAFRFDRLKNKLINLANLGLKGIGVRSWANDVSADGRIIVGTGLGNDFRDNSPFAFIHLEGEKKVIELTGLPQATATKASQISDDGKVVLGSSEFEEKIHPVFWQIVINEQQPLQSIPVGDVTEEEKSLRSGKLVKSVNAIENSNTVQAVSQKEHDSSQNSDIQKLNGSSNQIVVSAPIDIINSQMAMRQTANKAYRVLDLYQTSLFKLNNAQCDINDSNYCIGVFSDYSRLSRNAKVATGLFGTARLINPRWTMGGSVDFTPYTHLEKGYEVRKADIPALGLFIRYQSQEDKTGLNFSLSGTTVKQKIDITREQLVNTEAGKGKSKINGYIVDFKTGYGIEFGNNTHVMSLVGVKHYAVHRDGYRESKQTKFAADYHKLGYKRTDLDLSLQFLHQLTPIIAFSGHGGVNIKLTEKRKHFESNIDYIGAQSIDRKAADKRLSPYASVSVIANITPQSTVSTSVGWMKTAYDNNGLNAGLTYSYHW